MTRLLFVMMMSLVMSFTCKASERMDGDDTETTSPMLGIDIERNCAVIDIEGKMYSNVKVILESNDPDMFFTTTYRVSVVVKDKDEKTIYKKKFSNTYLYVFKTGQIQVGYKNFSKIVIFKDKRDGEWYCKIREKEGVWEGLSL